jgi:hypothetical protein
LVVVSPTPPSAAQSVIHVIIGGVINVGGGALATAVDVSTGAAVAVNDNDAIGAVVPSSLTNDKDAYALTLPPPPCRRWRCCRRHAGALPPTPTLRCRAAATTADAATAAALPPSRCAPLPRFALLPPPPPLTLPLPPCRR